MAVPLEQQIAYANEHYRALLNRPYDTPEYRVLLEIQEAIILSLERLAELAEDLEQTP